MHTHMHTQTHTIMEVTAITIVPVAKVIYAYLFRGIIFLLLSIDLHENI